MHKFIIVIISFCTLVNTQLKAQELSDNPKIAVRQGDFLLTGFFSYPNWSGFSADVILGKSNVEEYDVGGIAPAGLKLEYMLSNQFGFTVDGIYNSWSATWVSNPNEASKTVSVQRYRFQIGVNYHMDDLGSNNLDLYGGFGIGSNKRTLKRPEYIQFSEILSLIDNPIVNIPISFRFRIGGRYFFSENVGVNFELGTGGPILSGGLTFLLN